MNDYSRQTDVFDPIRWFREVHIRCLGSRSSTVLLQLMKMGVRVIHVYDDDIVEPHNPPSQVIYRPSDAVAKRYKVDAAVLYAEREELDTELIVHRMRVNAKTAPSLKGVVICCVDSVPSRKDIWHHVQKNGRGYVEMYIDGSIGDDRFRLHMFHPSDPKAVETYERWLEPTNGIAEPAYGVRGINYPQFGLASLVGKSLASLSRGKSSSGTFYGNLTAVTADKGKPPVVVTL